MKWLERGEPCSFGTAHNDPGPARRADADQARLNSVTQGCGPKADRFLTLALEACSGYRLAELLEKLTSTGLVVKVAKKEATAYRKR